MHYIVGVNGRGVRVKRVEALLETRHDDDADDDNTDDDDDGDDDDDDDGDDGDGLILAQKN